MEAAVLTNSLLATRRAVAWTRSAKSFQLVGLNRSNGRVLAGSSRACSGVRRTSGRDDPRFRRLTLDPKPCASEEVERSRILAALSSASTGSEKSSCTILSK